MVRSQPVAVVLAAALLFVGSGVVGVDGLKGVATAAPLAAGAAGAAGATAQAPVQATAGQTATAGQAAAGQAARPAAGRAAGQGAAAAATAVEPLELSLEAAVLSALEHNPALRAERLGPVVAGTFEEIERGAFATQLFAEGRYGRAREERVDAWRGERFDFERDQATFAAGVQRRLPLGLDWELAATQRFEETQRGDRPGAQAAGGGSEELHTTRIGLTLTQQLLRGRGREVNLVDVRRAELGVLESEHELRGFVASLIADVETAYWDFVQADRAIAIYEESLSLAEEEIRRARERIRLGDLAATELPALEAERALREQDLIDARSRRERQRLELLRLSGTPEQIEDDVPIRAVSRLQRTPVELSPVGEHLALALQQRPEIEQARLQMERDQLQVTRTRNGLLPRLELFVSLGRSGYADSFSQAPRELDGPSYDAELGVRLERPLTNRVPRAEHEQARLQRDQAELSLHNLARLVRHDVQSAHIELRRAQAQIAASAATREAQEERVRAEEERFRAGQATAFAVVQAQRDLLESQINEEAVWVDYRKALIELYRLDGTLLARRGIDAFAAEANLGGEF
ncbi:hypothetical protein CKO15_01180 [Halorhodospira abdelmalekii]|uniref:TolC family protein n=1 Tax=Halorhodospira abdelmalekii TaxID=421629 RepID=UPI00190479E2|nr:TolC family protein [Halorhodospira abdelmalekii]MBK1733913.1 hypothetical protein [Halorhodospira abdelmalekii]